MIYKYIIVYIEKILKKTFKIILKIIIIFYE